MTFCERCGTKFQGKLQSPYLKESENYCMQCAFKMHNKRAEKEQNRITVVTPDVKKLHDVFGELRPTQETAVNLALNAYTISFLRQKDTGTYNRVVYGAEYITIHERRAGDSIFIND